MTVTATFRFYAEPNDFVRSEYHTIPEHLLQRAAADELHPQANSVVDAAGLSG